MDVKCQPECVLGWYFPPDQLQKFANVHKVFGARNVMKLLNELHPHQREDAVNSLAYEADMCLRDHVYGCVGIISLLQHQLRQFQMDLTCAESELSKYQSLGLITAAHYHHHHHQNVGINLISSSGGGGGATAARDHHHGGAHHQLFPRDQVAAAVVVAVTAQQMIRGAFDILSSKASQALGSSLMAASSWNQIHQQFAIV